MDIEIRPEAKGDYTEVGTVNDLAFGQPGEGAMVEALRYNPRFIRGLSLVACVDGLVVGHILFFPVDIETPGERVESLSLAPLAVLPEYQNMGIGGKLIEAGVEAARCMGFASVIVMGHPGYYSRFGFKPASQWCIRPPMEAPEEAFMALELARGSLKGKAGTVVYPREYDAAL
ncbi:MAG: N-acetyltransferase [Actinobacteria bacterium]|jgi:predicted N-acetyltransferase YhbS|nr:MAG: N-acetyltransferase [Actinomycetota bacterium]